jgi:pimeloyl-ACP methyl ester carboxylesterase
MNSKPGEKPHLILLHGALGAASTLWPLLPYLEPQFTLHAVEFEGHGITPPAGRPFRIEHFVENVAGYLDSRGLQGALIFGYSLGGYVACSLALARPELVGRIATLGTKFSWDLQTAERENALLDPDKIKAKVPAFAQSLEERHPVAGWEWVMSQTRDLLTHLGEVGGFPPERAVQIGIPVRVMLGDRDNTVTLEETRAIFRALPQGEMEVLPNTPHPLERVRPEHIARSIIEFLNPTASAS